MSIEGSKEEILPLRELIDKQDKDLLALFPWFEFSDGGDYGIWEDCYTPEEESINISFGSKWSFPKDAFDTLVAKFPELVFEVSWEESGMDIYGKGSASEGLAHLEMITGLEYYLENNEDFAHEYKCLKEMPYEEFKNYILEDWEEEEIEHPFNFLEEMIVKRLKDRDLPLFLGKEWLSGNTSELIEARLKK